MLAVVHEQAALRGHVHGLAQAGDPVMDGNCGARLVVLQAGRLRGPELPLPRDDLLGRQLGDGPDVQALPEGDRRRRQTVP